MELTGFERFEHAEGGITKPVYRRGAGPGVVLMHELPGMVPECVRLGEAIASAGYTVYLPLFFGAPGQAPSPFTSVVKLCLAREFNLWGVGAKSPITDWLRGLARRVAAETGPGPIGAIGMCLTGSFALAMLIEDGVAAPVVSQPALPLRLPLLAGREARADLGLSPDQRAGARERSAREGIPVLGFRFEDDRYCPRERFETLERDFGPNFHGFQLAGTAHSVLTTDFRALSPADQTLVWTTLFTFLLDRLKGGQGIVPSLPDDAR